MSGRRSLKSWEQRISRQTQFLPGHVGGRVDSAQPVRRNGGTLRRPAVGAVMAPLPVVVPWMRLSSGIGPSWLGLAIRNDFVGGEEYDALTALGGQSVRLHLLGPLPDSDPFTVYRCPPWEDWSGSDIVINATSTLVSDPHIWPSDWADVNARYWIRLGEDDIPGSERVEAWIAAIGWGAEVGSVHPA